MNKSSIGRLFEKLFARMHSLSVVPGSGNGKFYKMDVEGRVFLYSLKATAAKSWRITQSDLDEVNDACIGPGGTGAIPALVVCFVEDEVPTETDPVFVMLKFDDLKMLMTEEAKAFEVSVDETKAYNSEIPRLFKT